MSGFNNKPSLSNNIANNIASNVSGIISTKASAKYVSGARTTLKINGQLVGFAFSISWRINTPVVEINTIDSDLPYELAPQRTTVEGTIGAMHIPGTSAGTLLWQPDILNYFSQQYIQIEVRDSATDQMLFFTDKAIITSRAEDIRVDDLASVQLTWKAIGYRDERQPETAVDLKAPPPPTFQQQLDNAPSRLIPDSPSILDSVAGKLPSNIA
jgi:hypothetical protein